MCVYIFPGNQKQPKSAHTTGFWQFIILSLGNIIQRGRKAPTKNNFLCQDQIVWNHVQRPAVKCELEVAERKVGWLAMLVMVEAK